MDECEPGELICAVIAVSKGTEMSYKSILVSLNDPDRFKQLIEIACSVAQKSDAHVIGLFVIPTLQTYPVPGAYVMPEMIESHQTLFNKRAEQALAVFDEVTLRHGVRSEHRLVQGKAFTVANAVIEHARQTDLVVIAQFNPDDQTGIELDFVDNVVMECGRPVLVVPHTCHVSSIGERIIVGWNATREAAHAVFDSLPLLVGAQSVRLIWVDAHKEGHRASDLPGTELAASLARHGVQVLVEPLATGGLQVDDVLLNCAADHNADLIVVGAYGHSRFREFVLGGVTRGLLEHMTVPVLMSH
jgi:nucleotide-binding universal stress UspA family protein